MQLRTSLPLLGSSWARAGSTPNVFPRSFVRRLVEQHARCSNILQRERQGLRPLGSGSAQGEALGQWRLVWPRVESEALPLGFEPQASPSRAHERDRVLRAGAERPSGCPVQVMVKGGGGEGGSKAS